MSLRISFLRPSVSIHPKIFALGAGIGVTFTILYYYFIAFLVEAFRITTGFYIQYSSYVEWSHREQFIYGVFYGAIASILGIISALEFITQNSIDRKQSKIKRRKRQLLSELGFVKWTFVFGYGKILFTLAIAYLTLALQYEFSFTGDFPFLLILIPLVLFIQLWPSLLRLAGARAFRWIGILCIYITVFSIGFGIYSYAKDRPYEQTLINQNPILANAIDIPESKIYLHNYYHSNAFSIYLKNSINSDSLSIFTEDVKRPISEKQLQLYLDNLLREEGFPTGLFRLEPRLFVDKSVTVGQFNGIKSTLAKKGFQKAHIVVKAKGSKYPGHHPVFRETGIIKRLSDDADLELFLDSAERLDFSKYRIRLPEHFRANPDVLKKHNRVKVRLSNDGLTINGQQVTEEKLEDFTYRFVKKYAPNYLLVIDVDETVEFGDYIGVMGRMLYSIYKLRYESLTGQNNISLESSYEGTEEWHTIKEKFPNRMVEFTKNEKRLIKLIENQKPIGSF